MNNTLYQNLVALFIFSIGMCGCVATSNYHSGRTLETGIFAVAFGADDISIKSTDKSVTISKETPFTPSIAIAYGLPYRIETGVRYFPTHFLEGSLRFQVNPRDFEIVDGSLNVTYARMFGSYSYMKYGVTISKNINGLEPTVHYSAYRSIGVEIHQKDLASMVMSAVFNEGINLNRSIGFSVGLPIRKAKLYPEIDYQYFRNSLKNGLWRFGVGLRVYTN